MPSSKHPVNDYVYLCESKIHNKGLFALKKIPAGTRIIEYTGELISKAEGTKRENKTLERAKTNPAQGGTYIFDVDEENDLDGDTENNYAKYANHSCEPNCKFIVEGKRVWIHTKKEINPNEEILVNYEIEWNPKEYSNYPCKCGSAKCVGYMLDEKDWAKLKERLKKLKK